MVELIVLGAIDPNEATAVLTDVKDPKTFFAGPTDDKLTGTMPTVAIVAANDNYPAGYHVGNGGGLDAIDPDLAPANIKETATIFGKVGTFDSYVLSDTIIASWDAEGSLNLLGFVSKREIKVGSSVKNEAMRTYFQLKSGDPPTEVRGQIHRNSGAHGILRSTTSGTYQIYTEDLVFNGGDYYQLYPRTMVGYDSVYWRYFRALGTQVPATLHGFCVWWDF